MPTFKTFFQGMLNGMAFHQIMAEFNPFPQCLDFHMMNALTRRILARNTRHPTALISRGISLNDSAPDSVMTTLSSIRTPLCSGR